ncbi:aldolase [Georgenia halophila]|uniref:Aldolase n=1 Tax=Georgenia halophila TaxID=620889 RepID=A0ABP8L7U4_9MICO
MTDPPIDLDPIARPAGTLAMVAMDQRESLRAMFDEAGAGRVDDARLVDFKVAVARALGPLASGFLIDRHYGFETVRDDQVLPPDTGLILAADALEQHPGGPVEETALDDVVVAPELDLEPVAAIKLLIIWRRDDRRTRRVDLAREFVAAARRLGVLSVLEPVVRATPAELEAGTWDLDTAIREAAEELSGLGQSLYKVQVPRQGRGTPAELRAACGRLDRSITGPWVVLSQGVDRENYLGAVTAACQAGASGFLAGRALWSDVVGAPDVPARLQEVSVPRLERLVAAVDRYARPWREP